MEWSLGKSHQNPLEDLTLDLAQTLYQQCHLNRAVCSLQTFSNDSVFWDLSSKML